MGIRMEEAGSPISRCLHLMPEVWWLMI